MRMKPVVFMVGVTLSTIVALIPSVFFCLPNLASAGDYPNCHKVKRRVQLGQIASLLHA